MVETGTGSEDRRYREFEVYPPPLNYQWEPIERFPEENQESLRNEVENLLPGYSPREILFPLGRREEIEIVGLALESALLRTQNITDYPHIGTRGVISTRQVGFVQNEEHHVGYLFSRHNGTNEENYLKARSMLLEALNANLDRTGRNKIPPPQSNDNHLTE